MKTNAGVESPLTRSYWPASAGDVRDVTISELLRSAAQSNPERLALVDCVEDPDERRVWNYAELLTDVERVARALLARYEPGQRVAVWAPNSAEWVLLQQGLAMAGLVLVGLNPAYRLREMRYALEQSGSVALFLVDTYRGFDMRTAVEELRTELPDLKDIVSFSDWDAFLEQADDRTELPEVAPDDVIQIQYTSGTTGSPKGAMLHHKGLVNEATFVAERAGMQDGGVYVNAMPMYHIGGGAVKAFGAISKRGTFVLLPDFNPGLVLEAVETYRGTHSLLVPTMLIAVLDHPDRPNRDLSSLQAIMSGAAVVPASLVRRTTETLSCGFTNLFGQTEAHGVVSQTSITDDPVDQSETIGRPLPGLEVKISDPDTGETTPVDVPGEICVRGYQTMLGYFAMPGETASTIDDDGWLHMGDLGTMDSRGYLRVTGRLRDMIIRGGMNLYPAEIEGALQDHPAIQTAVVIGVPDEKWGEQVGAVLTVRPGHEQPSLEELDSFMRTVIAPHKVPTHWTFVPEVPMTTTGKIQKFVLTDQLKGGLLEFEQLERRSDAGSAPSTAGSS